MCGDALRDGGSQPAPLTNLETFVDLSSGSDANEPLGTLGDYTLRRQIGRGGMGVVYEGVIRRPTVKS